MKKRNPYNSKLHPIPYACHKLGIDPDKLNQTPKITHILAKLPGKRGHAGIQAAIEFLRGSDNDDARKFISLWDDMPMSIRQILPFEAFCLASDITTKRMLEIITGACFEQSDQATSLIAATAHPEIVRATIQAAMVPRGFQDRKMLHLNKGFLPVSKNQTTILSGKQNSYQINSNNQQTTYTIGEVVGIEKRQERIADRFNERLGLGSGHPVIDQTAIRFDVIEPDVIEPDVIEPMLESEHVSDADDWGT